MINEFATVGREDPPASAGRYRRFFESALDGMIILEADLTISEVNPAVVRLSGYSPRELIGRKLWEVGLFQDPEEGKRALQTSWAEGSMRCDDVALVTKAGTHLIVDLVAQADAEGVRPVIQCQLRDVTGRRHTEAGLRQQNALLVKAQRFARLGNWSLTLPEGRLDWSAPACALFGITPAEFGGTVDQFRGFILAEDLIKYDSFWAAVGPAAPLAEFEFRIVRPDGAVRWIYERSEIAFDSNGVPTGQAGMFLDITGQHDVKEQLTANATHLAQIAGQTARLGGWTIELPDRKLSWSDENCAIHDVPAGYQPTLEEGIGYFLPEHRQMVTDYVRICATQGTPYDFELPKLTALGRLIWVRSIGEAVRDADGKIIRIQGAFQDITARKLIEAEKEKLIAELRSALAEIKTLREFLPICSYCAKVRDDENYWSGIENYISRHTGTQFTHGICPECYDTKVAPELEEFKNSLAPR